jgi:hypothetical protein
MIERGWEKKRSGGLRRGATAVIRVLRKVRCDRQWARQKKLTSKVRCSYYCFLFISAVRVVSIPTPYVQHILYEEPCCLCKHLSEFQTQLGI